MDGRAQPAEPQADDEALVREHAAEAQYRSVMRCPNCGTGARIRTSKDVTPTFRELFFVCNNLFCAHSWKASLSYEYGLSPSGIPNPELDLPMRPVNRAIAIRAGPEPPDSQPGLFDLP